VFTVVLMMTFMFVAMVTAMGMIASSDLALDDLDDLVGVVIARRATATMAMTSHTNHLLHAFALVG